MEDLPGISPYSTWLLTQGVLGFTTALGLFAAGWMWRSREMDRDKFELAMQAKDNAHDAELAQWIKLNQDLQAERYQDLKIQNEKLASANDLVRQLFQAKGGQLDKVS